MVFFFRIKDYEYLIFIYEYFLIFLVKTIYTKYKVCVNFSAFVNRQDIVVFDI